MQEDMSAIRGGWEKKCLDQVNYLSIFLLDK